MIKYNGYQVSPAGELMHKYFGFIRITILAEIEDILLKHPDVMDTAVVGIYDSARATELPLAFSMLRLLPLSSHRIQL